MTSPGEECTTAIFEKHGVWPERMHAGVGPRPEPSGIRMAEQDEPAAGKVTGSGRFAIRGQADIMPSYKIVVLF
jgi:hypothetical protein